MMQAQTLVVSTAYLAPIAYYSQALSYKHIGIEAYEFFVKQTYRNRCEILGANGKQVLSIPLQERKNKSLSKDLRIDYKTNWQQQHWRSIESAYSSSPFFEYFQDDLLPFYKKQVPFLLDFNFELQQKITELMNLQFTCFYTTEYVQTSDEFTDARNLFSPKKQCTKFFPEYIQVFEGKLSFEPNLSILDLLLNLGNESETYLRSLR